MAANGLGIAGSITIASNAAFQYVGTGVQSTVYLLSVSNNSILDASGSGTVTFSNPASPVWDATNVARTLSLTGTSLTTNTLATQFVNNGSGAVSLVKSGSGTWALSHTANLFSGGITVERRVPAAHQLHWQCGWNW